MGATFYIATTTTAEFLALQSEGAPDLDATYSTGAVVLAAIGIVPTEPFAMIPAGDVAAAAATLREAIADGTVSGKGWAFEGVAAVCEAAARLGRGVSWA